MGTIHTISDKPISWSPRKDIRAYSLTRFPTSRAAMMVPLPDSGQFVQTQQADHSGQNRHGEVGDGADAAEFFVKRPGDSIYKGVSGKHSDVSSDF